MKKQQNTGLYLAIVFGVVLLIGVGYAALSATLNINGQTTVTRATWDVHLANPSATTGTVTFFKDSAREQSWGSGYTADTLYYSATLPTPGSTAVFTVDVVNNGTIDAEISSATLPSITGTDARYSTVACVWNSDDSAIEVGNVINANSSKTIRCTHTYKTTSELTNADLTAMTGNVTTNTSMTLGFIQH